MKIFFKVLLGFIISLFRREYQLKDVLKENIEKMAQMKGAAVWVKFKLISGTKQEYIMTVRFLIDGRVQAYTTAVFNEVSRDRDELQRYVSQFIDIFSKNVEESQSHVR